MFSSSTAAVYLVIFSVGVHIAEAIDMLLYCKPSMLLLHHIMVIICFSGALLTKKAIGFAVLSLVTEINAVFNKTRILHIITGIDSESETYKRNALVNVFTFFIRILIIGWMNNQCFNYLDVLPLSFLVLSPNFNQVLVPKIRLNELIFHEWFYQIPKCRKSFDYY